MACNPGMCPDRELNQQPFGSQAGAQSTEPHQPGPFSKFLIYGNLGRWFLKGFLSFLKWDEVFIFYFLKFFTVFLCWHYYRCSPFSPSWPTLAEPLPSLPSGHHHTAVCVHGVYLCVLCLISSPSFTQSPTLPPSGVCQSLKCIYTSDSVLSISVFASLECTDEWDHMVFVFLWLVYFA